jgi:hypothetical protein
MTSTAVPYAINAPQDSALYNRMHTGLQSEYEKARKRKLEALEDNEPPQQQVVTLDVQSW